MKREHDESKHSLHERGRKPKGWRSKVFFPFITLCLGVTVAIVIAEVALRLFVDQEAKRLATYDARLGWRGRPNGSGVYIRKVDNIRVPFRYNNLGFRDEDVTPKPSHGHRILMLGDSFVENLEVEYSQTFPALLEQQVKARSADWDVAVVGSQGYSTSQELLAFRKYHQMVSPDVVLLCFYCGNDFEDNLRPKFAYLDAAGEIQIPPNQEPWWKHYAGGLKRWLYESSHLVYLLKNSIESTADINLAADTKSTAKADDEYKREITKKLVFKLAEEVRATGAEFAVVLIPFRDDLPTGNHDCQSFLKEVCADNAIPVLDLSPLLDVDDYFETDIHFNLRGHRTVARAIDDFLAGSLVNTQQ